MTLLGPAGQPIKSSESYSGFTYIPDSEVVRGIGKVREATRVRIDFYERTLRTINHPKMGMAAKGFSINEIKAAKVICNNNMDFYRKVLESME